MLSRPVVVLALLLASALTAPAAAAPYEGRVAGPGYGISFTLRDGRITNLVARVLVDCDRDGHRESLIIEPRGSWAVRRRGRFSATRVRAFGAARSSVTLRGTVRRGVVRGVVRERQTVDGGAVCDTGRRGFTARRA